jgi:hypothetical protein
MGEQPPPQTSFKKYISDNGAVQHNAFIMNDVLRKFLKNDSRRAVLPTWKYLPRVCVEFSKIENKYFLYVYLITKI